MHYPRKMTLELTAKCNFSCPYCYCVWHEYPLLAKEELGTAGWKKVLDKCAADGVCSILFTGGEALLRPDLFAILDHARQCLPMSRLSLFTNARLLDKPLIKRFKSLRLHLATSLQGLATYGAMTGTAFKSEWLLDIVAHAAQLGWPMTVSMTITSANIAEATDMFVAAVRSGANSIQLHPVMAGGRAVSHPELMITRPEWERVKSRIRALPNERVPYSFGDEFICKCRPDAEESMLDKWVGGYAKPCPAGKAFGVVGPNGTSRSCIHSLPIVSRTVVCLVIATLMWLGALFFCRASSWYVTAGGLAKGATLAQVGNFNLAGSVDRCDGGEYTRQHGSLTVRWHYGTKGQLDCDAYQEDEKIL